MKNYRVILTIQTRIQDKTEIKDFIDFFLNGVFEGDTWPEWTGGSCIVTEIIEEEASGHE